MAKKTRTWKLLICGFGKPAWNEMEECGGTFDLVHADPDSVSTHTVAEMIAEDAGIEEDVTLCLMDPKGTKYEVDICAEQVTKYRADNLKKVK